MLVDPESKPAVNCVYHVDNDTLIKNLEKPYLFVTAKHYADTLQMKDKDHDSSSSILAMTSNALESFERKEETKASPNETDDFEERRTRMESMSFADTNFALENLVRY